MVESKMVEFKLAEFKVAAIIKLSQNEWVKFFLCKMATKMAEFNMAAIIKLSQNELVGVRVRVEWECFWVILKEDNKWWQCLNPTWQNDGCHHQVESELMSEVFLCSPILASVSQFEMSEFII